MAVPFLNILGVEDLYGFLGVTNVATDKEIKKAYRKKALRYHPDKNPDNPSAADMFQKLSNIYNILTDPAAKAAYDKWLKAKELIKRRNEELSVKRRKLKQNLESKENEHFATLQAEHEARQMMKSQIERLREQSLELIRVQEELLRKSVLCDDSASDSDAAKDVIIQISWEKKNDFSVEVLTDMFSKYGPVEDVVRKKNKAMISFKRACDAVSAIKGLQDMFKFRWVSGEPPLSTPVTTEQVLDTSDYEEQVFERLRKAQERKDLERDKGQFVGLDQKNNEGDENEKRTFTEEDTQRTN